MFTAIAIHHPHADHVEDFVAHMRLVVETTSGAALPLIGANRDRRRPEWTVAEDELLQLSEL